SAGWRWRCARNFATERAAHRNAPPFETHDIALLRRAGIPLAVIAEIGSRRRIVGLVSLHAVRHGIIAGRGCLSDRAVVVISVRVIVVVRAVGIGICRADAGTDRDARPEAAATVVIMAIAAV